MRILGENRLGICQFFDFVLYMQKVDMFFLDLFLRNYEKKAVKGNG